MSMPVLLCSPRNFPCVIDVYHPRVISSPEIITCACESIDLINAHTDDAKAGEVGNRVNRNLSIRMSKIHTIIL